MTLGLLDPRSNQLSYTSTVPRIDIYALPTVFDSFHGARWQVHTYSRVWNLCNWFNKQATFQ